MAFNLEELKRKKEEVDTFYLNKLKNYLDSDIFEDKFKEFLSNEIDKGKTAAILIFEVNKTNRAEVFLSLKSNDLSISYEFCQDSQDRIGNLNKYIDCIEIKLLEFGLNYKDQFELLSDEFDHIAEHSTKEYKFFIDLKII